MRETVDNVCFSEDTAVVTIWLKAEIWRPVVITMEQDALLTYFHSPKHAHSLKISPGDMKNETIRVSCIHRDDFNWIKIA